MAAIQEWLTGKGIQSEKKDTAKRWVPIFKIYKFEEEIAEYISESRKSIKDTHMEKAPSNKTPAHKKYEYGHLGFCYIKSILYKRFLNWNKIFKKIK